jgi:acetyltransferase-like isoleucine patch superfamily enzyme
MSGAHLWATPRGRIDIGARTYVGNQSWIVANDRVTIGSDVLIAPFCYIQDTDHGFDDTVVPIAAQASRSSPIEIGDDVWLGAHVVVTRGVTIGRGSVIGAGSVVTRDVPPGTIAAGVPARPMRSRAAGRGPA